MKRQPPQTASTSSGLMKKVASAEDYTNRNRQTKYWKQNATWDPPVSTSGEIGFAGNRRDSNGPIPGLQLPAAALPSIQHHISLTSSATGEKQQHDSNKKIRKSRNGSTRRNRFRIYDDPQVVASYNAIPTLELNQLPRGGVSIETQSIGRVQFGIPPETIKDSMRLGFGVPSAYIVPVERFCREMGPALGINLAEFEFPAYFNYFVRNKRCTLVVDSDDAESNIRRVFGETLLGPAQFRDHLNPKPNEDEDFDPSFPKEARPNFYKEFYHFRTAEKSTNFQELTIDTLLEFCHFKGSQQGNASSSDLHCKLGVPPVTSANEPNAIERVNADNRIPFSRRCTFVKETEQKKSNFLRETIVWSECAEMSDEEDDDTAEPPLMRRSMSNPDVRMTKISMDNVLPLPPASPKASQLIESDLGDRKSPRRGSLDSAGSYLSNTGQSRDGTSKASGMSWASFMLTNDDDEDTGRTSWMYSQVKWLGEVATVYPLDATEEQKANNTCGRLEIFKMAGGTEYIIHDINSENNIVGKAQIRGSVKVPDEIAVEGFHRRDDEYSEFDDTDEGADRSIKSHEYFRKVTLPTFHPPSFGVTVLGNSHGFDKNGSVSGYVLWINGRGVMIDPPPYSSATLEREGIRPQMIMAIIITHCHADHDAGTFQKVMTGSRVAIITTPTIYKSFIRKYAALSGLSPTLLRHSHRHRPAIIGQPLKFQGATFYFTYTLHTIPCIAFRVEWRGRSMVFTGDHLNSPGMIDSLESVRVLTKERADDLRRLPLQECDVLLHEAGAPPIHTPLSVLNELPEEVRKRLYVVHTSALPPESGLRVAPTGTAGTIRLDLSHNNDHFKGDLMGNVDRSPSYFMSMANSHLKGFQSIESDDSQRRRIHSNLNERVHTDENGKDDLIKSTSDQLSEKDNRSEDRESLPLVFLRPTCVSDAWFILNLLSNVPFLSSLSYYNTMEVLEIAQVEMFSADEVVISSERRSQVLCVVWEGTCVERRAQFDFSETHLDTEFIGDSNLDDNLDTLVCLHECEASDQSKPSVWHAGDWTGPVALQPDIERSAESGGSEGPKDIVALSTEGVKVILLNMKDLYQILKSGSKLFRKYLTLKEKQAAEEAAMKAQVVQDEAESRNDNRYGFSHDPNVIQRDVLTDQHNHMNWYAYDSVLEVLKCNSALGKLTALQKRHLESLAEGPRYFEVGQFLWQVGNPVDYALLIVAGTATFAPKSEDDFYNNLRVNADHKRSQQTPQQSGEKRRAIPNFEEDKQLFNIPPNSEYARLEIGLQLRVEEMELDVYEQSKDLLPKEERMRNARDRFANKVLARLYSRRAYTSGLVFSRGHLLSDTSRMVSGNLAHIHHAGRQRKNSSMSLGLSGDHHCHTSNMIAGPEGCVAMVFPRSSLVPFLDGNPGVLLSLLGTQVVV